MIIYRPMTPHDISQVIVIEHLSFPTPWSERSFRYEVTQNPASHLFVVAVPPGDETDEAGLLARLVGQNPRDQTVIGFSGFWMIAGEVHVSTIAVHPDWRGRKLGELLFWGMIRDAIRRRAEMVTLEVRVGNAIAQNLYRKYHFEPVGIRKGYYRDNKEDALLMTLAPLDHACRERVAAFGKILAEQIGFIDDVMRSL